MSEVHVEEHSTPIQTPQQLIVVVLLAFLVPILLIVMVVQLVTGGIKVDEHSAVMSDEAVAKRLKPVGEVAVGEIPASTAAATQTTTPPAGAASAPPAKSASGKPDGAKVYQTVCSLCHGPGLAGAPKFGDKAAWKPRIGQGLATLHEHAIKGIRAMPAKGANPTLSDTEVSAAVDYMVGHSK
jgi:cytochrome c5